MRRGRGRSHGNGGRPHGLQGRDIGMYYRRKKLEQRDAEEQELSLGSSVSLSEKVIATIESKLNESWNDESTEEVSHEFHEYFKHVLTTNFDQFIISKSLETAEVDNFNYERLNERYKTELDELTESELYKKRYNARSKLPVCGKKTDILRSIEENSVVLISGDTGCGKTTQIPQYILDEYIDKNKGSECRIVCTQPRRISAITVAERVAWERCERIGQSIGYQIRLESVHPREVGSITYCTTGTLLRKMESDPLLSKISHIILDEIHERNVETDLLLGLLKKIFHYRKGLKIILMSATFSFEVFAKYFNDCPIIQIKGTLFAVEEKYLEDVLEETRFANFPKQKEQRGNHWKKHLNSNRHKLSEFQGYIEPYARSIRNNYSAHVIESISNPMSEDINLNLIKALVFHISAKNPPGAILVFLPGFDKISKLHALLTEDPQYRLRKYVIYALHSMMPTADQRGIFIEPPQDTRKVIIATNIAETSITVEDVVYVINSGKIKMTDYDVERNLQTFGEQWVSIANAHQRRGRAGRVRPGVCYHLYTRAREHLLEQFPRPEIVRSRLESLILNLKMLHINNVKEFMESLLDKPHEKAVENGIQLLKRIGALDDEEYISPLGLHLARLPIEPQMGKMILMGALFRCVDPITSVAASLSFKDGFYRPLGKEEAVDRIRCSFAGDSKSDHLMAATVISKFRKAKHNHNESDFCYRNFLSASTLNQLERMKTQFCDLLQATKFIDHGNPQHELLNVNSSNINLLRGVIASGLYPNVACLRKSKQVRNRVQSIHMLKTPEDGSVQFHNSSTNIHQRQFESRHFVYFLKQKTNAVSLLDSTMVYPMALLIFGEVRPTLDNFGNHTLTVGNVQSFRSDDSTNKIIMRLRYLFNNFLQKKALYPSPVEPNSRDAVLLECIQVLLSQDDKIDVMALSSGSETE